MALGVTDVAEPRGAGGGSSNWVDELGANFGGQREQNWINDLGAVGERSGVAAAAEPAAVAATSNESYYFNVVEQAAAAAETAAWWLGGWYDTEPSVSNLRERLESFIRLQSKLRGVAISLSWVSASENFTLVAGEWKGRKVTEDDIFLFGSGTKPYTAVGVMRAVEAGRVGLDDAAAPLVDKALRRVGANTTLAALFGPRARLVTLRQLLHMSSGIADFDYPAFDDALLQAGVAKRVHTPLEFVLGAAAVKPPFICEPGSCVSYSSTNYVLLGLVLLALDESAQAWYELDQKALLGGGADPLPRSSFLTTGPISDSTTLFGKHGKPSLWPLGRRGQVDIGAQDASILGWVCGNLASTTGEVAQFFWELLIERSILRHDTIEAMAELEPLGLGWGRGHIAYGLGLMLKQTSWARGARYGEWGTYLGHGGNTYGFLSEQGLIPQLNATFSVVANSNADDLFVAGVLTCQIIAVAAEEVLGHNIRLPCGG